MQISGMRNKRLPAWSGWALLAGAALLSFFLVQTHFFSLPPTDSEMGGISTMLAFLSFTSLLAVLATFFFLARKNRGLLVELDRVREDIREMARSEKAARKDLFYQSVLAGLAKLALSAGTFKELLAEAVELLKETMKVDAVEVLSYDGGENFFFLEEGLGWRDGLVGTLRFPADPRYLETFGLRGEGFHRWTAGREGPRGEASPHAAEHGFRAGLCVAVPGEDGPYGIIAVFRKEAEHFSAEEGNFLLLTADILGDALILREAQEKLRKGEERLEMVLKGAGLGTWTWEIREGTVVADGQFLSSLEKKGGEERWTLQDFQDLAHPEDRDGMISCMEENLEGRKEVFDWEGRLRTAGGGWRWFHVRGRVIDRDETGAPLRMAGVVQDVTEKKQLETQLFQAQKLESVGRLAAGIAHEINTPTQYVSDNTMFLKESGMDLLRFVEEVEKLVLEEFGEEVPEGLKERFRGLLEDLDMEFLREEVPKAIDQSLEGLGRVAKIVRAMKDFSHPGSAVQEPTDLNKAVQSTVTIARNEWKYVSDLETHLDPDLPLVRCFSGDFNQVILNLIVNAAHAIGDVVREESGKKGKITVTTRKDGNWAEIRVQDTGTGIPEEIRDKIFEPFFTTKPVGKGTGQGLSLVYSVITQKHGGEVRVESEVGKGSTFILRIPIEGLREGEQAREKVFQEGGS